jgi:hypothetical protein
MWDDIRSQSENSFQGAFSDGFGDDVFAKWDPFGHMSADEDGDVDPLADPFLPPKHVIRHNRTISSPMKLISVGLSDPATSHVATMPVEQTSWGFSSHSPRPRPILPKPADTELGLSDSTFALACKDPNLHFNPTTLGFLPVTLWPDEETTFGEVIADFFQRKNNANCRFSYKLFNALRLGELNQVYTQLTGVCWLNDTILRVDKRSFARLLGIKSIDGSLFYQQGNFPSHGFFEIGSGDQRQYCPPDLDLTGVDFENVRLLFHVDGQFRKGCTGKDIEDCRWANWRKGG